MHFLGKFDPKSQNCFFKLKLGIYNKSNMVNSMMMFIFFGFGPEILFLEKFASNYQSSYKFLSDLIYYI